MEKNSKDFIHLYLGCEVLFDNKIWRLKTVGGIFCHLIREGDRCAVKVADLKIILRPLNDMSEGEFHEVKKIIPYYDLTCFTNGRYHYYEHEEIDNYQSRRKCEVDAGIGSFPLEAAPYLLSKHFDVFGLIPAGLAIDKTKI